MTDESQVWGQSPGPAGPTDAVATAPAGWYLDPWSSGHHRYWDGTAWTGGSFPHGPANPLADEGTDAVEVPLAAPPAPIVDAPLPPPQWSPPPAYLTGSQPPPTDAWGPSTASIDPPSTSRSLSSVAFVALVVGIMLVVGSLGTLGGYLAFRHKSNASSADGLPPAVVPNSPSQTIPGLTIPGLTIPGLTNPGLTNPGPTTTLPTDPSASALQGLGLTQADVASAVVVQTIPAGDQVAGEPTLDLCNGNFPSESLRTARHQVAAYDAEADPLISTEAVLYTNPAATQQAFSELQSVAAKCPSAPVASPVGEGTATTQFNAAPDSSWPQTPSVDRQAYDFVTTDDVGTTQHSVAVYLCRGRVLLGIYFSAPDAAQVPVAGQTSIESIAGVFAGRMANLAASVVNG